MSFEADDVDHERTIKNLLEQQAVYLAAIVTGIALMNNLTPKELIELSKGI